MPDVDRIVSIPGERDLMIDGRGTVNPRWRRFFEEISGAGATSGDVLVVGDNGTGFDSGGTTSTISADAEFFEFWRN